jgi:hypothetical protein
MANVTYDTIDKIRRLAEDEGATPGERAAAQAKLEQYRTALVVRPNKSMTMWDRVRATTTTIVAEEERKCVAIRHTVERAEADMAEYRIAQKTRIARASANHEVYMIEAEVTLAEARHRANLPLIKIAAERQRLGLDS